MKYTNNDLAKAMVLEVGKTYIGHFNKMSNEEWVCVNCYEGIGLQDSNGWVYGMKAFIDIELTEVKKTPKLTEQEITILKGRQAEGATHIKRAEYVLTINGDLLSIIWDHSLFQFIKHGEKYSIAELLEGQE